MLAFFYTIIILPLESIIEFVFNFSLRKISNIGIGGAIIFVSLTVNFLALPLYNIADNLQLKERDIQKRLAFWTSHIKQTFRGDERYMMLSTWYRLNNYNPLYALRSSLSILIEIPFFIAAYHFLSHCDALKNQSFLFLANLGEPDNLLKIGNISFHLLPIIMTAINCISGYIYSKEAPFREKMQIYVLAAIFLILLYESPSGLVFYWILNNLFSLAKNIVQKYIKKPYLVVWGIISLIFLFLSTYTCLFKHTTSIYKKIILVVITFVILLFPFIKKKLKTVKKNLITNDQNSMTTFLLSLVSTCILAGITVPINVISTSPSEFSYLGNTESPISYVISSFLFYLGLFIFWPVCIYKIVSESTRKYITTIVFASSIAALFNVFIFKYDYGLMNIFFIFENKQNLTNMSLFYSVLPIFFLILILIAHIFIISQNKKATSFTNLLLASICISQFLFIIPKYKIIHQTFSAIKLQHQNATSVDKKLSPQFHLSKNKKNVIVIFEDKAVSGLFPLIIEQMPELKDSFTGFTYYPNTISHGSYTNLGTPAMLGGYDYTLERINERANELLKEKQNEALLVLPTLFNESGYELYMYNSPYINYHSYKSDSEFYSQLKNSNPVIIDNDLLTEKYKTEHKEDFNLSTVSSDVRCRENCKRYSLMCLSFPIFRETLFNEGAYFCSVSYNSSEPNCLKDYAELYYLPELTDFTVSNSTYTFIGNQTTHEITDLIGPDFRPSDNVNETNIANCGSYKWTTHDINSSSSELSTYHINAAFIIQIAKFFRYLKENDCYDNSRIIIVADHGAQIHTPQFDNMKDGIHYSHFNPLFMVKDFYSTGLLKTDYEFHTNADVPYILTKEIDIKNINPFTKNEFKTAKDFESFNIFKGYYDMSICEWNIAQMRNRKTFTLSPELGWNIHNNIFIESNWTKLSETDFVGEHSK